MTRTEKAFNKKLGLALKKARSKKGLSQIELSRKTKIRQGYLSGIESGKVRTSYFLVHKILKAMNLKEFPYAKS